LSEIGLPPAEIPVALLFFNIGVELDQLVFVFVIVVILRVLSASRIAMPRWAHMLPTYAIGTLAMYWFLERSAVIFGA